MKTVHIFFSTILFGVFVCIQSGGMVLAEEEKMIMEELPPHLAFRVEQRQNNLSPEGITSVSDAVVTRLKVWQPESFPIKVCFFGGSADLRIRIIQAAREWTRHEAHIPLDFGNPQNPRICTQTPNDIKIGFAYNGYWSLIGQDSRDLTNAFEQSMNFAFWDAVPAKEPEFTRTVIHEFGHALGFQHEHQNPWSNCEREFNWPLIYSYLGGSPNYWKSEKVDHNMRKLFNEGLEATPFDKLSIMLYTFPEKFYFNGRDKWLLYRTKREAFSGGPGASSQNVSQRPKHCCFCS